MKSIDPKNFENLGYSVFCENVWTHSRIEHPNLIQVREFLEDGLILTVPQGTCAKGHHLLLHILPQATTEKLSALEKSKKKLFFEATGFVSEHRFLSEQNLDQITLQLKQYDHKNWEKFRKLFQTRQDQLSKLIKGMKA